MDHIYAHAVLWFARIAAAAAWALLLMLVLAVMSGCSTNMVMQMNQVCGIIPDHRIEYTKDGSCVFCYAEHKAVAACVMEDKGDE